MIRKPNKSPLLKECLWFFNFSDEFQEFTQGIWRFNNICPIRKAPNTVWEYLQQRNGEDEIWLKDDIFSVQCIQWRYKNNPKAAVMIFSLKSNRIIFRSQVFFMHFLLSNLKPLCVEWRPKVQPLCDFSCQHHSSGFFFCQECHFHFQIGISEPHPTSFRKCHQMFMSYNMSFMVWHCSFWGMPSMRFI